MAACEKSPESAYREMEARELASGQRQDSIFFGLHFGMKSRDFFEHCFALNRQGLVRQGPKNESVMYEMKELRHPATMNFYPSFSAGKIYEMPVLFAYKNWAPWNKELSVDSLHLEILHLFETWYGTGFITLEDARRGKAFVKVDGNRRISIFKRNDHEVRARITDLLVEKKLEAQAEQDS